MFRLADEGIVAVGVAAGGRRVGDAVETGDIEDGQDRPVLDPLVPQIAGRPRPVRRSRTAHNLRPVLL